MLLSVFFHDKINRRDEEERHFYIKTEMAFSHPESGREIVALIGDYME